MAKNVPLLRKVMDQIISEPWTWDQHYWAIPLRLSVLRRLGVYALAADPLQFFEEEAFELNRIGITKDKLTEIEKDKSFTCDTAFCVAGWACFFDDQVDNVDEFSSAVHLVDGQSVDIEEYAQRLLGLTELEACVLFEGSNDFDTVISMLDRYIAEGEAET